MDRKQDKTARNQDCKMTAVDQARDIFLKEPFLPGGKLYAWFNEVGSIFHLSPRQVRKIYYGEVKRIDADTMDRIRLIHEERLNRLEALKAKNDENQRRINELVYRHNELKRSRPVA